MRVRECVRAVCVHVCMACESTRSMRVGSFRKDHKSAESEPDFMCICAIAR